MFQKTQEKGKDVQSVLNFFHPRIIRDLYMKKSKSFLEQENVCVPEKLFGAEAERSAASAPLRSEKFFLEHKLFLFQKSFVFFACKDPLFSRFLQF